jgi:hypothetical protein
LGSEILRVIKGIKGKFSQIDQITGGENFSAARAKGFVFKPKTKFSLESLAVFPGVSEMEAMDSNLELENSQKEKVRDFVDSVLVVDYVVPSPQALCFSLFHGWVSLSVSLISPCLVCLDEKERKE